MKLKDKETSMNFLRKKKKEVVQRPGRANLHTGHQKTDIQS